MQQITHKLPTGTLMFLEIPNDGNPFTTGITAKNPLPDGDWQLLGDRNSVTEEQLKEIMPYHQLEAGRLYFNFNGKYFITTALEAYTSLKISLGVVDVNAYDKDLRTAVLNSVYNTYESKLNEANIYREAQEQVKSFQVLFKKD